MIPLHRMMIEEMRIRKLALSTQTIYVRCVARYAMHFGQSPDQLGPEHVHEYLSLSYNLHPDPGRLFLTPPVV